MYDEDYYEASTRATVSEKKGGGMVFNDPAYVKELADFIQGLGVKRVLEVGYHSAELVNELRLRRISTYGIDQAGDKQADYLFNVSLEEYECTEPYELVFSSGVIEHYPEPYKLLQKMAALSSKYVLTIVPHTNCLAYMNAKAVTSAEWRDELDYTEDTIEELHRRALRGRYKNIKTGVMGEGWAKRFGSEPSEPYLVYALVEKLGGELSENPHPDQSLLLSTQRT